MGEPTVPSARRAYAFEFPGLRVGCAEYADGPTGCTVIVVPPGSLVTVDIRGGSPAVVMGQDGFVEAVCLTGGSLYGLGAVAGVTEAAADARGARPTHADAIPVVRGAALYDLRDRANAVAPDAALGAHAYRHAVPGVFPLGPVAAGRSATVGKTGLAEAAPVLSEGGGQGAACGTIHVHDRLSVRLFACAVVNSVGGIVDRDGQVVRGQFDPKSNRHLRAAEVLAREAGVAPCPSGNTTLSVIVMDNFMPDFFARQAARQIHTSMARALDPFHTEGDGDVLFFIRYVREDSVAEEDWSAATRAIGGFGSELMWDAVLSCWQS